MMLFMFKIYPQDQLGCLELLLIKIRGPLTYDIELEGGRIIMRHVDNLHRQHPQTTSLSSPITTEDDCLPTAVACSDHSSVTETTDSAAVPLSFDSSYTSSRQIHVALAKRGGSVIA